MTQLGLIGLGTMGANLARNAARNGAEVVVFNRTTEKTDAFMKDHGAEGTFVAAKSLQELAQKMSTPRAIVLMVKAGSAVDDMIHELLPLLSEGDILIDAGNSHDSDTRRRVASLESKKIRFVGMGVSGGEEGALNGPSMMPGGSKEAFELLKPLLQKMAADDGDGGKCVAYIGPAGTGHFVKTVHNGIEYGIMQLIAESYHLLKGSGLSNAQIADLFEEWNKDQWLQSFLTEITVTILRTKDVETGADMVDVIKDAAAQKGTGKWTTESAMTYGVAIPTITAAVDARIVSSAKDFRMSQDGKAMATVATKLDDVVSSVKSALTLSVIHTYAQGFQLLSVASDTEKWNLNIPEIARIWCGGCIIRSAQLKQWQKIFSGDKQAAELMQQACDGDAQRAWRRVVSYGVLSGVPLPAMSATLTYHDAYRTGRLPQNVIQAQRDLFGAHTFERLDKPGTFHINWGA